MSDPLLRLVDLKTHFQTKGAGLFGEKKMIKAVDGVSFDITSGEVLSLVGESGCGKSTVGRTLTHLEKATSGQALFEGQDFLAMSPSEFRPLRREIQMIFQDPFASLNPRLKIEQTLGEPLFIHGLCQTWDEARTKIAATLELVGMDPKIMSRHPHEFSGGQRQRIGIARVMILKPKLVIADEAVSALDVSIQAQVLNLIKKLQRDSGVSMLFISHDLGVVRHISDRVAVMLEGKIVEIGDKHQIFEAPQHDYTRKLLGSIPRITIGKEVA
jgi:ABC-type oligopeptide transport system ATPase subunit